MITDLRKFPMPYFGGKAHAAPVVWAALGDVCHYVEPFCGSCAVLLRRPHEANRSYYSETINDASGLLVNALRSLAYQADATADAASWYVSEADISARQLAVLDWARAGNLERLMADVTWCDPTIAGYYLHGVCSWIGSGYAAGDGPWIVGSDGRLTRRGKGDGRWGMGDGGVARQLPHLSNNGCGVHHAGTRERGVARKLPHLSDDGRGVHHAGTRERGVASSGDRSWELGVGGPDLRTNSQLPTPISRETPISHLPPSDGLIIPDDLLFHDRVMPELTRWFQFLSARLRHVRIVNGDWKRVCTTGAMFTLPVRQGDGVCGVFIDPPYGASTGRAMDLYDADDGAVADAVRAWCLKMGGDRRLRIVLAGFDTEHTELEQHGWSVVEWFESGYLRGGLAQQSANGHQQRRERLWLSPACLGVTRLPMDLLWEDDQ